MFRVWVDNISRNGVKSDQIVLDDILGHGVGDTVCKRPIDGI